uniref:N-acetyltransferase domain-containing protein n=1 Tax=viral metagenome TaxID=1070528 RepID=A0A6C0KVC0_9ZZZZ
MLVMVFWKTHPFFRQWSELFLSQLFEKSDLPSPTHCPYEVKTASTLLSERTEIIYYLQTYFGVPPLKPILDHPEDTLIGKHDEIIIVRDVNEIVGTLRYKYAGEFVTSNKEPIYLVDCFCIHPLWRRKGVGDYLLTQLHRRSNERGRPYALFLKEGAPLSIWLPPLYTGTYVYREICFMERSQCVTSLYMSQAYRIMDHYRVLQPNLFVIRNPKSMNQIWKLYRKGIHSILCGIQDSYQRIGTKKMGWITAWIESPAITDDIREEASRMLSDACYPRFNMIWMDKQWVGNSTLWTLDGQFHWYAYQWTTNVSIQRSYCIMT